MTTSYWLDDADVVPKVMCGHIKHTSRHVWLCVHDHTDDRHVYVAVH